jgi:hypothetical protein
MKRTKPQKFPPGWNEKEVRAVIDYYDNQTENEAAAEIDAAEEVPGHTWMSVPTELVPEITRMIEARQHRTSNTRRRNRRALQKASRRSQKLARR